MGTGETHNGSFVWFLTGNLLLYCCWIIFSAYAGTFKPPGSSFPIFFLGYVLAGLCWLAVGFSAFGWSIQGASRWDLFLIALAGICGCSGTMFLYRALAAATDENRSIVYIVSASYPAITFVLAILIGYAHSKGLLTADSAKNFAVKLGYDPGNYGKNLGLVLVLIGGMMIAWFTKQR